MLTQASDSVRITTPKLQKFRASNPVRKVRTPGSRAIARSLFVDVTQPCSGNTANHLSLFPYWNWNR